MKEEILDIVDENNNPTGETAVRSKVHAEGIWHRTVHIYLFRKNENQEIEFLVQLRASNKDLYPNCWDTRFGGHIEAGADIKESMKRELVEEIGLDNFGERLLIEGEWLKRDDFPNREFTKVSYLEYDDKLENLVFNDGEVQKVKWMSAEDISNDIKNNKDNWTSPLKEFDYIYEYLLNNFLKLN